MGKGHLKISKSLGGPSIEKIFLVKILQPTPRVLTYAPLVRGACISFVLFSVSISMIWLPSRLNNSFLGFVSLLIALVTSRISISVIRIAYFIMVKNVTLVCIRSRLLAIDADLVMITRTASQVVFGWFFSWSLSNLKKSDGKISFPFNEPFTFYVISFFGMLGAISVSMCSKDAEKP